MHRPPPRHRHPHFRPAPSPGPLPSRIAPPAPLRGRGGRGLLATRPLLFARPAVAPALRLVGLATVLSLGLVVIGAELAPATIGLDIGSTAALIAAELGVLLVGLVLAALVTVVTSGRIGPVIR